MAAVSNICAAEAAEHVARHVSCALRAASSSVGGGVGLDKLSGEVICSSVELLEWAVTEMGFPLCGEAGTELAAGFGRLDIILRMREWDWPLGDTVCQRAAACGSLEVLQWARAQGCAWDEAVCTFAAENGHLHVVQYARRHGCPWDHETCTYAAEGGHMALLQWAHAQGCEWNCETTAYAAEEGHLDILVWLRQHHCPWDTLTCAYAARAGRLRVLQWVREHGGPWDEETCTLASGAGQLQALKWARSHGCPWTEERMGTWMCCSGREHMDAIGIPVCVTPPKEQAITTSLPGHVSMGLSTEESHSLANHKWRSADEGGICDNHFLADAEAPKLDREGQLRAHGGRVQEVGANPPTAGER
eukprot:jgi/Tetstr1/437278/TSEL_026007.t1